MHKIVELNFARKTRKRKLYKLNKKTCQSSFRHACKFWKMLTDFRNSLSLLDSAAYLQKAPYRTLITP